MLNTLAFNSLKSAPLGSLLALLVVVVTRLMSPPPSPLGKMPAAGLPLKPDAPLPPSPPDPMRTLIVLVLAGWFVAVTFFGPEIFNAINGPKPAAVKRVR